MPKIKRWFPVSHHFNRDNQVRELRRRYADWMGYVWLEMCSISDLNEGVITGSSEEIAESLAYISMRKRPSFAVKVIQNSFDFMVKKGWIRLEIDRVLIVNYAKYHRTQEHETAPSEPSEPSIHTNQNTYSSLSRGSAPSDSLKKPEETKRLAARGGELSAQLAAEFNRFWTAYPKKENRRAAEKVWSKLQVTADLASLILQELEKQKKSDNWRVEGGRFVPQPDKWLRRHRWQDEVRDRDVELEQIKTELARQSELARAKGAYGSGPNGYDPRRLARLQSGGRSS